MVKSQDFVVCLKSFKLSPFLMVPCSIFKPLASWLLNNEVELIFPPNEAQAMGFAIGSYSVTGKLAVIFIQNSGLNNIANCQTSLNLLYKVPVLLVVSWRGEPGKKDAPEHEIMGKILKKYLNLLQIPYRILSEKWKEELNEIIDVAKTERRPVAVVVRDGFFVEEKYPLDDLTKKYQLSRFEAIKIIKKALKEKAFFISTNGFASRESFAVADTPDFYMMGSMGHAFSIGAGTVWSLAGKDSKLKVVVLDGDGGCLMHLGSLALVGLKNIKEGNLIYVVLDNEAYESTGTQPSLSPGVDFAKVAKGLGFPQVFSIKDVRELKKSIKKLKPNLASFIHIKVNRKKMDTPRVSDKYTCEQITKRFMDRLRK